MSRWYSRGRGRREVGRRPLVPGRQQVGDGLRRRRHLPFGDASDLGGQRPLRLPLGAVEGAAELAGPPGQGVARELDDELPHPGPPRPQTSAHVAKSLVKILDGSWMAVPDAARY